MWPNKITAHNAGWRTQFRFRGSCHRPGVCEFHRSALLEVGTECGVENDGIGVHPLDSLGTPNHLRHRTLSGQCRCMWSTHDGCATAPNHALHRNSPCPWSADVYFLRRAFRLASMFLAYCRAVGELVVRRHYAHDHT